MPSLSTFLAAVAFSLPITLAAVQGAAPASPSSAAPWWNENAAAYIGAFGGSGVGILGGGLGALMGMLVPRGKGKLLVLGLQGLLVVAGLLLLVAAVIALINKQPYHVAFPLALGGCILTCVLAALAPMTITIYQLVDVRKAESPGVAIDPRQLASCLNGLNLSARAATALDDLWGDRGWLRHATGVAVIFAVLIAVAGAVFGIIQMNAGALAIGVVWIVIASPGLVAAAIMLGISFRMRLLTVTAAQASQKQRLAAEEFRRG